MRLRGIMIALAALALGACETGALTGTGSDAVRPRPESGPRTSLDNGQYWTEEEYEAAGGMVATDFSSQGTTSGFSSDMRSFSAASAVSLRMVTDVSLNLSVKLLKNDGTALNDGGDSFYYNGILPLFSTQYLRASIGTLNHKCGITGKARLTGTGGVRVITTKEGALFTIWSRNIDEPAPDKTVADCVVEEECSSALYYANGSCNESEEPAEGGEAGGGGSGGGSGSGSGGGSGYCTLWQITVFVVGESGERGEIIDQYYFWDCA